VTATPDRTPVARRRKLSGAALFALCVVGCVLGCGVPVFLIRQAGLGPPSEHRRELAQGLAVVVTERADHWGDGFMECGFRLEVAVVRDGRRGAELTHDGVYDDCSLGWAVGVARDGAVAFQTNGALYRENRSAWVEVQVGSPRAEDVAALQWTMTSPEVDDPWSQASAYRALRRLEVPSTNALYDALIRRRAVEWSSALSVLCPARCEDASTTPEDVRALCTEHAYLRRPCGQDE